MADEKKTSLSIVIRTVDEATAKINAINARLDAVTKPVRDFKKALGELKEKSGLSAVADGFKGVGSAIEGLLSKAAMIGGVVGLAVGGVLHLVNGLDDLGKKAHRLGVGVDFLAEMRFAAERAGVPVDALDSSLLAFNENLGQVRAGTGRMAKFLGMVSPALLQQLKGAKDNAAAFDLLAGAMAKVEDPAKRAALAQKTLGDSALAPLFAAGPKGLRELRDRYFELAGSQEGASREAEITADAMADLHAASDGLKAGLVRGLAPAFKVIIDKLRDWLVGHRDDVARWATDIGQRLPDAVARVVGAIQDAIGFVGGFLDKIGGVRTVLIALAGVSLAPLISAFVGLGAAMLTTPFGLILAGIVGISAAIVKLTGETNVLGTALEFVKNGFSNMDGKSKAVDDRNKEIDAARSAREGGGLGSLLSGALSPGAADLAKSNELTTSDYVASISRRLGGLAGPNQVPAFLHQPSFDLSGQTRGIFAGSQATQAKVTVDFANAPPGTRVKTDPQSTADVDLSVGYQMLGAQ